MPIHLNQFRAFAASEANQILEIKNESGNEQVTTRKQGFYSALKRFVTPHSKLSDQNSEVANKFYEALKDVYGETIAKQALSKLGNGFSINQQNGGLNIDKQYFLTAKVVKNALENAGSLQELESQNQAAARNAPAAKELVRQISEPHTANAHDAASVQPKSIQDTQEFKSRVANLEREFGPNVGSNYENFIERRMTANEGSVAKSLSDTQYYAIKEYSTSAFADMNAALRNPSGPQSQNPRINALNASATSALKEIAAKGFNFSGITNRGVVNYDYFIQLREGDSFSASAFTSTSTSAQTARNAALAELEDGEDSTIIHTYGKTGVNISSLSDYPSEAEILYPPDSKFRVIFSGDHIQNVQSFYDDDPPTSKKVSYLVVEEISTSPKTGVSGITDALDLAGGKAEKKLSPKPSSKEV